MNDCLVELSDPEDVRGAFLESLRSGQLMESLFDTVPGVLYFVKDLEGRFMGCSRGFARAMGVPSVREVIGKTDYDFSPDFLADAFFENDRMVLASGKAVYDKLELVPSANGSLDWLCTSKIPLYGNGGDVVGLAGVARSIRDSDAAYAEHPEIRPIVEFVRSRYREKVSVLDMAAAGGISVSSQERLFRKSFGLTPLMYLRKTRLNAACAMLRDTEIGLAEIASECGLGDQTNMTRAFRLELKITPLKYRRRFSEENFRSNGSR